MTNSERISCPYCQDGKSKKKRAYILTYSHNNVIFKCHNCGESKPYADMLKEKDRHQWSIRTKEHPQVTDTMRKQVEETYRSNSEDLKKRFNANLN